MSFLFWLFLILLIYCYFGYPLGIWILSFYQEKEVERGEITPSVSILISVYNEADVIENKIKNLESLKYKKGKLKILIGCDGCSDNTASIIKKNIADNIVVIDKKNRRGKISVLNNLVSRAKGEILVFTDARQEFDPNAVSNLVKNFEDPKVGCASGELIFKSAKGSTSRGISLYWNYEKLMRSSESKVHSMLGATGAIYAIRKKLFCSPPEDIVLDDMYIPLKIIEKGHRAIFDSSAIAYDKPADNPQEEHRRKTRTLYGNFQMFRAFAHLFHPGKSPIAIQFFSHKFLRVTAPFLMIGLFLVNMPLATSIFGCYFEVMMLQILFYILALCGYLLRDKKYGMLKPIAWLCYVPYVFCLLNFSALVGFLKYLSSGQSIRWEKARSV